MEPIKINVNIEVGLKQSTIEALKSIFGPQIRPAGQCFCALDEDEEPPTKTTTDLAPTPEPEKPKTVGANPEGTGAEYDDDDLPPGDAPDPVKETPTETDTRNAVAAAKKRGVAPAKIRSYMKENFNISTSVECPAERRQELIDGLNKLAA